MERINSIKRYGDLLLIRFGNQVRVFGIESLTDLLIQYEQEISSFTKAHAEALEEIIRLKKELKNKGLTPTTFTMPLYANRRQTRRNLDAI